MRRRGADRFVVDPRVRFDRLQLRFELVDADRERSLALGEGSVEERCTKIPAIARRPPWQ